MTYEHIQLDFIIKTHYADIAEKNNIILMFPMAVISTEKVRNPRGCWDFWGYCDEDPVNFATKDGKQTKAIMSMVNDLKFGKLITKVASDEIFKFVKCPNKPFYDDSLDLPTFPAIF